MSDMGIYRQSQRPADTHEDVLPYLIPKSGISGLPVRAARVSFNVDAK